MQCRRDWHEFFCDRQRDLYVRTCEPLASLQANGETSLHLPSKLSHGQGLVRSEPHSKIDMPLTGDIYRDACKEHLTRPMRAWTKLSCQASEVVGWTERQKCATRQGRGLEPDSG